VLYNFGRADQVDRDAIRRLISSLSRALDPGEALAAQAPDLHFIDSRPMGDAWLLDQLWAQFGFDRILRQLLHGRRLDPRAERVLFAMVCNRALEPLSKLQCSRWVSEKVVIPDLDTLDDDTCYRTMDWLMEIQEELQERVYWSVADLLNLEVDLLFFDTTSSYFETDLADEPGAHADKGFRSHSKDHRPDRPQIVVGLAVTRDGIPIRVWSWPGNTNDQNLVQTVKGDLRGWKLSRVVWVMDTGFHSAENRRYLQRGGGHYIVGEKLRGNDKEVRAALSSQGRTTASGTTLRSKRW
jgi:transposase